MTTRGETKGETVEKIIYVEDTPFSLFVKENEVRIIVGNQMATKKVFNTEEEAKKEIKSICKNWELMVSAMFSIYENFEKFKQLKVE